MSLDLSFVRAARVLPKDYRNLRIFLIGAGGTGSFAAMCLARLALELRAAGGKTVELTIIDPDRVEAGNIPRSNFCVAEIGRFKAETLAARISLAWGLEVGYCCEELDYEKHIKPDRNGLNQLTVLVGCVDNHLARRALCETLLASNRYNTGAPPAAWWIDGGNGRFSGQVLIGSAVEVKKSADCFSTASICKVLPAPSAIHPELLEKEAVSKGADNLSLVSASCPERIRLGEQSLNVNQRVAVEIGEMLTEFLLTNNLRRFATYFDLESGTSRSLYTTPDHVEKVIKEAAGKLSRKGSKEQCRTGNI